MSLKKKQKAESNKNLNQFKKYNKIDKNIINKNEVYNNKNLINKNPVDSNLSKNDKFKLNKKNNTDKENNVNKNNNLNIHLNQNKIEVNVNNSEFVPLI